MKISCVKPGIWLIDNLLSQNECKNLILEGETLGFTRSKLFEKGRNNFEIHTRNQDLVDKLIYRLCETELEDMSGIIKISKILLPITFYRYGEGDFVARHSDAPVTNEEKETSSLTLLIYLNDTFEGGETIFHSAEIQISPLTGSALIFRQTMEMVHEGSEVIKNVKYIFRANCY